MNKETIARQQITIADVHDGEKGAKGDTGANGSNGAAAEFYRLQPQTEKAIVASDNVLRVNLEYTIEHVKGAQISVETGAAQGYHLIAWTNQGVFLTMTAGRVNSGTYQMVNYSKTGDRPDFINVELRDKANKTLDRRTVQITMEAASFVNVIGDVRETVSQNGKDITTIRQDARGINLVVEGLKQAGVTLRNGQITLSADKTRIQGNDGTPSAIFNADGTIDARRIIAKGTEDRIEYGIIDGRANLIIKDKQGNTMLLLNRNGIVLPTDITAYARRFTAIMSVKEAHDGVYLSVSFGFPLYVRNTGFQRSTFGNNIRIEVDVPILGIKDLVVPVGSGQGKTLNVDETGEILYVATWNKQYKVGTPVPLTPEFEYRVLWRNKVIDKGTGEITRMHEGS